MSALIDDLDPPPPEAELARRRVLAWIGGGALGLCGLGTSAASLRFFEPSVLYREENRFSVGRPESIAPGTVLVIASLKVYLVHSPAGFFALSAVCTHLGCITRYQAEDNTIACPCHGSRFSAEGRVIAGPAPRPLRRLALSVEQGELWVDLQRTVTADAVLRVS